MVVKQYVPIVEIDDKTMKFYICRAGINKRNCVTCSIRVNKSQYVIKQSGSITEDGIETDALFLLLLMYYVSSKYKHILLDQRLMIGCSLNPQMKNLIPPDYYQDELLNEIYHININCYFSPEEELYNYLNIKMEENLSYDEYWNYMKNTFRRLYYVSLKYRTYSASELSIERLFSRCQFIHQSRRNALSIDKFSKLSCLQYNLKKSTEEERTDFFRMLFDEILQVLKETRKWKK